MFLSLWCHSIHYLLRSCDDGVYVNRVIQNLSRFNNNTLLLPLWDNFKGEVNFQNLKNNPLVSMMLISDELHMHRAYISPSTQVEVVYASTTGTNWTFLRYLWYLFTLMHWWLPIEIGAQCMIKCMKFLARPPLLLFKFSTNMTKGSLSMINIWINTNWAISFVVNLLWKKM